MVNSLRKSILFISKAVPGMKIDSLCVSEQIDESTHTLHKTGFNTLIVISNNHSMNLSAFNILIEKYPFTTKGGNIINHPSTINNGIYTFFNPVTLLKNIRTNLFNFKKVCFSPFKFE